VAETNNIVSSHQILLVEDEPHLAFSLKINLEAEGYRVRHVESGTEALKAIAKDSYSAVILDVMIPELDGFEVARFIRSRDDRTGILMLTARASEQDRILGLEAGVDDYITKPFNLQELLLRVRRMVERSELLKINNQAVGGSVRTAINPLIECGPFRLNPDTLDFSGPNGAFILTALEADVLRELMVNHGRVLTRTYLLNNVWKIQGEVETRTVDNFIMRLRRFVEKDPKQPEYLQSVRGRGYRFSTTPGGE
jgi:two-component system alkaline phosphatase synthesis response regulator PhoP